MGIRDLPTVIIGLVIVVLALGFGTRILTEIEETNGEEVQNVTQGGINTLKIFTQSPDTIILVFIIIITILGGLKYFGKI